jgi:hypothetical protein
LLCDLGFVVGFVLEIGVISGFFSVQGCEWRWNLVEVGFRWWWLGCGWVFDGGGWAVVGFSVVVVGLWLGFRWWWFFGGWACRRGLGLEVDFVGFGLEVDGGAVDSAW